MEISFKNSDKQKLADGTYTIYAIGYYETGANYKDIKIASAPTTTTGEGTSTPVAFPENGLYALLNNNANPAEEIFAGQVEVTAKTDEQFGSYLEVLSESTADKKVVPALVLNRQVAGVTGYFTNLPAKVGEQIPTKIRLVASNKSNKVHFTSMASGETDGTTTAAATSVVNGSAIGLTADLPYWNSSKKGYKVYEIDLANFFAQMSGESAKTFDKLDLDGDGFVGYKDAQYYVYNYEAYKTNDKIFTAEGKLTSEALAGWENAIKGGSQTINGVEITCQAIGGFWKNANANQTLVAGSVFAGEFIIPFLQVSGTNTFELQLLNGDNILKTWNVQVPSGQTVGDGQGSVADGIEGTWSADTNTLIYNIYRNHLYSLGMKTNDIEGGVDPDPENPNPDPKPEPDPDPNPNPEDKPEDLSKGQDLLINVNDNWEIIHNMEID